MLPFLLETPANNTVWVLIALGGATILYALFRPSMRNKKDPLAQSPLGSRLAQQRNTERQMESLLVELSEMARQVSAQLDTRSQKLEILIQQADERLAALERANNGAPPGTMMTRDDREAWTIRPEPPQAPPTSPEPVNQMHQEIYALADQGAAAAEIARQLNRPRGEVELILRYERARDVTGKPSHGHVAEEIKKGRILLMPNAHWLPPEWFVVYVTIAWSLRAAMVPVLLRREFAPGAAIAWLGIVFLHPYIGFTLYMFIGERALALGAPKLIVQS